MTDDARAVRAASFVVVVAALSGVSVVAGLRGFFSSADRRLTAQILDPTTRLEATGKLATQIATAAAPDHPIFAGASGTESCPGRYSAQATAIVEAMNRDEASATINAAADRLRAGGWTVDPTPQRDRRLAMSAHNTAGFLVAITEVAGTDASSIEVTVTVPCSASTSASTSATPASGG